MLIVIFLKNAELSYKIFTKTPKKHLTLENIFSGVITSLIIFGYFLNLNNYFVNIVFFSLFLVILIFIPLVFLASIFNSFRFEMLNGTLNQSLKFTLEGIIISEKLFHLNSINKIEIDSFDYKGRSINHKRAFKAKKSLGTRNKLKIVFNNKTTLEVFFQQITKNEIFKDKFILIEYCNLDKIHYLNLLDILKISDYDEIQIFKNKYLKQN